MKKTLAAVLAAMMALSTATVAFADDSFDTDASISKSTGVTTPSGADDFVDIGSEKAYDFATGLFDTRAGEKTSMFTAAHLGALIDAKAVKTSVKITEGRANLASLPTLTSKGGKATLKVKFTHNYKAITENVDPVEAALKVDITATKSIYWDAVKSVYTLDAEQADKTKNALVLKAGDTVHVGEIELESGYVETMDYGTDMTFTTAEVSANETVIFADTLVEELEGEALTLYFGKDGDLAAWTGKIADNQKDLNVYYSLDAIDGVEEIAEELEIEPEYITFKGDVKFYKSGTLTFNAVGDEDTVVYEVVDGALVELESDYDATYNIVTVDGIKKLTSYVVSPVSLEVEEEAEAETEAPAVEEENPNTGAC